MCRVSDTEGGKSKTGTGASFREKSHEVWIRGPFLFVEIVSLDQVALVQAFIHGSVSEWSFTQGFAKEQSNQSKRCPMLVQG